MGLFNRFYMITILLVVFSYRYPAHAAKEPWTGTLRDGTKIYGKDLAKIISDHKNWLEKNWKDGKRAILSGANLQGVNLIEVNLQQADLSRANLQENEMINANLQGAEMIGTNLQYAILKGAKLQGATLNQANLQNVKKTIADQ